MKMILSNTLLEKILLFLSAMIIIVGFCIILHGVLVVGDIFGGILFSSLPISLISVILVSIAQFCKKSFYNYAKIVWIMSSFLSFLAAVLCTIYYVDGGVTGKGAILVFNYSILILGFPCSFFVHFLLFIFNIYSICNDIYQLIAMFFTSIFAGYIQWFILLPWILRKLKARNWTL
jgi:hypothetical protein